MFPEDATWVQEQSHRQAGYAWPVPPLRFIACMYHFVTSIYLVNLEQAVEAQDKSEGDTLTGPRYVRPCPLKSLSTIASLLTQAF